MTDPSPVTETPPKVERPALARWIWERDLELRAAAALFGCSPEQVRRICLPFGDPGRRVPGEELLARIHAATGCEIGPADFYPARFRQAEGAAA